MFKPKNDIYKNWNKDLYIAVKDKDNITYDDYNNEIVEYYKPFYFGKVNYQPLTRKDLEAYIQQFGETKNNIVSCLINYTDDGKIHTLDLAYLYNATPNGEIPDEELVEIQNGETIQLDPPAKDARYGSKANYIVRSYKPQNTKIMVIFEELVKEEN